MAAEEEPMSDFQRSLQKRLFKLQKPAREDGIPPKTQPKNTFGGGSGNPFVQEILLKKKSLGDPKEGGAKKAPPAPVRRVAPKKTSAAEHEEKRDVGGAITREGGGDMKTKVAELAAKLGQTKEKPPVRSARPKLRAPIPKAAKPEKQVQVDKFEEVAYMNYKHLPREKEPKQAPDQEMALKSQTQRGSSSGETVQGDPFEEPPPLPERLPEDEGVVNSVAPPIKQRRPSQSRSVRPQGNEQVPPPAPKRTRSFRAGHGARVTVSSSGNGEGSGGSTSGTSGDGLVVRGRGRLASDIVPVGSSSESEYSGDGRVERLVQ